MKVTCSNCNDMNREEVELEVFDLLESKDFQELSTEEQSKVLLVMTESEYQLQRKVMLEAGDTEELVAGPLVLPGKKSAMPIWFASVGSAAAAAIIMFFIMQPAEVNDVKETAVKTKVVRDTLIVENTVTDTIVDYRVVHVKEKTMGQTDASLTPIPEAISGGVTVPPIRENDIVNVGISAANDPTIEEFRVQPFIGM